MDRDCQAPDTQLSLPPRAPDLGNMPHTDIRTDLYFSVFTPPARLTHYFSTHLEGRDVARRIAHRINFDYYSPDNCPDLLTSDDSDSTDDDDLDYEYAKLGFF